MKTLIAVLALILLSGCQKEEIIPVSREVESAVLLKGNWYENDNQIFIQLDEVNRTVDEYYAEITNDEERRFSVNLGLPDKEKIFRIPNIYGKPVKIVISTLIGDKLCEEKITTSYF